MGEHTLAVRNGVSLSEARRMISQHKAAYPQYWRWRQTVADTVLCGGSISTCYGWTRKARRQDKATSITNFPI